MALNESDYRTILIRAFGVDSAKTLAINDLAQAVALLENIRRDQLATMSMPDPGNHKPTSKRIWAAWYHLKSHLPPQKQSAEYLASIARRHAPSIQVVRGKLDFDLIPTRDAHAVIRGIIQAQKDADSPPQKIIEAEKNVDLQSAPPQSRKFR